MTPQHFQEGGLAWIYAVSALIPALTVLLLAVVGMLGVVLARLHDVGKRQDRQGQTLNTLQLNAPPPQSVSPQAAYFGLAPNSAAPQAPAPVSGPPGAAQGASGQGASGQGFADVPPPAPFDPNKTIIPGSAAPTGEM